MHLSDVVGETCPANVACLRARVRHIMHPVSIAPMKPAAAKVDGNHGPIAGRRLAVGFLQIVPGVFPTGVVTDRLLFGAICGHKKGGHTGPPLHRVV